MPRALSVALVMGIAMVHGLPPIAAQEESLEMEEGVHAVGTVVANIRQQTGREVYVDRRCSDTQVFVAGGAYTIAELLDAVGCAAGLVCRDVGGAIFLAETAEGNLLLTRARTPEEELAMVRAGAERHVEAMRFLAQLFDFASFGAPFVAEDFLAGDRGNFSDLTQAQREFVASVALDRDGHPLVLADQTVVRLIPAVQVTLGRYAPRKAPPRSEWWETRFGTSPEEWESVTKDEYMAPFLMILVVR